MPFAAGQLPKQTAVAHRNRGFTLQRAVGASKMCRVSLVSEGRTERSRWHQVVASGARGPGQCGRTSSAASALRRLTQGVAGVPWGVGSWRYNEAFWWVVPIPAVIIGGVVLTLLRPSLGGVVALGLLAVVGLGVEFLLWRTFRRRWAGDQDAHPASGINGRMRSFLSGACLVGRLCARSGTEGRRPRLRRSDDRSRHCDRHRRAAPYWVAHDSIFGPRLSAPQRLGRAVAVRACSSRSTVAALPPERSQTCVSRARPSS